MIRRTRRELVADLILAAIAIVVGLAAGWTLMPDAPNRPPAGNVRPPYVEEPQR